MIPSGCKQKSECHENAEHDLDQTSLVEKHHHCSAMQHAARHHVELSSQKFERGFHTSSDDDLAVHLQAVPEEKLAFAASRQATIVNNDTLSVGTPEK